MLHSITNDYKICIFLDFSLGKSIFVWYESKVPHLYIHAYDANGFKVQKTRS